MKICSVPTLAVLAVVAILSTVMNSKSIAAPQYGASVFVDTQGEVVATFQGHSAGLTNDLYLDSPATPLGVLFTNQTTTVGTQVSLGLFDAGTELIFRMHVNGDNNDFFTGPASRNPDSVIHAYVDEEFIPDQLYVAFEDLLGGGDFNYFDLTFSLTNTRTEATVPEPTTCLLGGFAVGMWVLAGRRNRVL